MPGPAGDQPGDDMSDGDDADENELARASSRWCRSSRRCGVCAGDSFGCWGPGSGTCDAGM